MILKQFKSRLLSAVYAFAALCLMAACSEDDDYLPGGTTDTGGVQEYTLTVGIDRSMEGDTRATSTTDDDPTRCFMQVFDESGASVGEIQQQTGADNYTFTVSLAAGKSYTFCFWADNGTQEITSLTEVPYTPGNIAFAYTTEGTPEAVVASGIKLAHVVAKVSLVTTAATTIAKGEPFTASTQCAETYNVLTGTASGTQDYATLETSGSFSANADVTSFYVLPATENQDVTLNVHLLTQTIPDVALAPNTHVTLRGDLSENNENWRATDEYKLKLILSALFDEKGNPQGELRGGFEYYFYGNKDDLNAFCQKITRNPNFEVSNDNNQFILGNYGDNPCVYVRWNLEPQNQGIITYIDDSNYYEFIVSANSDYPAFPVID